MTRPPFLSMQHLVKSYDGKANAVDGISLDIACGEFVSFLGPSGSGKTSTLLMIAGFEDPTAGEVVLNGQSLSRVKPYRRGIGMVFQNYALFPHMSVEANVAYPLRVRRVPRSEAARRVAETLSLVGLSGLSGRYPRELSGGQQQRVALARALVFKPNVLLLDEPLGALDKQLREQMQFEIKRIQKETGVTTVYVTHDQSEAMTLSDRIAVFNRGVIEQVGAPLDIYRKPKTRFVAGFIGDSNLLEAELIAPGKLLVTGLGAVQAPKDMLVPAGSKVHLLVRPEAFKLVGSENPPDMNTMDFEVSSVLNYGDNILVAGNVNGVPLRIRSTTMKLADARQGDRVRIGWHLSEGHVVPVG